MTKTPNPKKRGKIEKADIFHASLNAQPHADTVYVMIKHLESKVNEIIDKLNEPTK